MPSKAEFSETPWWVKLPNGTIRRYATAQEAFDKAAQCTDGVYSYAPYRLAQED